MCVFICLSHFGSLSVSRVHFSGVFLCYTVLCAKNYGVNRLAGIDVIYMHRRTCLCTAAIIAELFTCIIHIVYLHIPRGSKFIVTKPFTLKRAAYSCDFSGICSTNPCEKRLRYACQHYCQCHKDCEDFSP